VVQLPQRRRPLEDGVTDVAFGARPLAPRRPPTRTDSTATPRVTELRGDNVRGQRARITDGEGATSSTTTAFTNDPQRLWLTRLRTVRAADSAILQDRQYSRDHVGNVIEIDDEAQQTHGFDNAQVSPERTYAHDPLYRLSSAIGRENHQAHHGGLVAGAGGRARHAAHLGRPAAHRNGRDAHGDDHRHDDDGAWAHAGAPGALSAFRSTISSTSKKAKLFRPDGR
jgi:hypothetical protein